MLQMENLLAQKYLVGPPSTRSWRKGREHETTSSAD